MDSRTAGHVLGQIAAYLELKGENAFKVRAYQGAARGLLALSVDDVTPLYHSGELGKVRVGPDRHRSPVAGGPARRSVPVLRAPVLRVLGEPAEAEAVRVHRAVALVPRRPGLLVEAVRGIEHDLGERHGGAEVCEVTAHQLASPGRGSRAVRKPAKICRRTG